MTTFPGALWLLVGALLLGGCSPASDADAVVAKVNNEVVTLQQLNEALARHPNLRADDREAVARRLLDALIDQELALQQAEALKLDRQPQVAQQLAAARREIMVRAFAIESSQTVPQPTPDEVRAYFEAHPALFSQRQIYSLQEVAIELPPSEAPAMQARLAANPDLSALVQHLRTNNMRFAATTNVRAAEQLPPEAITPLAQLQDGQVMSLRTSNGLMVLQVQARRAEPLNLEQAKASIEQHLGGQRKAAHVQAALKALRESGKVEYRGVFARPATPAASSRPSM
jgi:EpsD family peptidyl-prolyl cis-trans isomerase